MGGGAETETRRRGRRLGFARTKRRPKVEWSLRCGPWNDRAATTTSDKNNVMRTQRSDHVFFVVGAIAVEGKEARSQHPRPKATSADHVGGSSGS
uniref:Uncharacterized protein n=1 Tax=Oryza brachyantha TaxID=4533 RepID=J3LCH6_ORYBR